VTRVSRLRRRLRHIIVALAAGSLLLVGAVVAAGFHLSSPAPERIGPPPADLPAEMVSIKSPSGSMLAGWFVTGRPGNGAVVLMHGVQGNRLAMLRRARLLIAEGFSVLLFDFQAHGESPGRRITFGYLEGKDATAAVAFVRARLPQERIGAIGSSLGGAAALLGPVPLSVDALVLESVYSDIVTAIENRFRVILGSYLGNLVARPMACLFELVLPPFLGMQAANLRPIDRISQVTAPLLIAGGTVDTRTTIAETRAMFQRAPEPKILWEVEGMGHFDLEGFVPDEYRKRVVKFLKDYLRR